MTMRSFDASLWNLAVPLGAFALGCGPLVPAGGDTDTDGDTDPTDPTNPSDPSSPSDPTTDPTDPTDPTGARCPEVPCPPGYYCSGNECVPDYYCADYCCYDDGCCKDGCWYDCYGLTECGYATFCEGYGYCVGIPVPPACGENPPTNLAQIANVTATALAFLDGNGDAAHELVVGSAAGVSLVPGGGGAAIDLASAPAQVIDLTTGDVDGDGDEDILVLDAGGMVVALYNFGGLSFSDPAPLPMTGDAIEAGDFDGNGTTDVLVGEGTGLPPRVWVGLPGPAFEPGNELTISGEVAAYAHGRIADPVNDSILVQDEYELRVWVADGGIGGDPDLDFSQPYGIYGVERVHLATGDFDGDGIEDIARSFYWGGFTMIDAWHGATFTDFAPWGLPVLPNELVTGDLDGDGTSDLMFATDQVLAVRYGNPGGIGNELFGCAVAFPEAAGAAQLATGDFDGNGRDDVALTNAGGVFVFSQP